MNIELTREQLLSAPVRITDPETSREYVVVEAEVYDRLKDLLDEDDARAMYPGLAHLDPEDWENPSNYNAKPSR